MKRSLCAILLCVACNPGQALQQQVGYATNKDYTGMALDEKREADRRKAEEDARKRAEDDRKRAAQEQSQGEIDKHVRAGQASMDLGDWDTSIKELKEAYRLSADAKYLPMIALATRKTGDCTGAKTLYQQYLDKSPSAADKAQVQGRVQEAEACEKRLGNNYDKVKEHYQKAVVHYNLSEYDEAAKEFKEAYRLSNDPLFLFNIAQAYRSLKNCGEASKFYERYLTGVPDAEDKERVKQYIAEMKKCK